MSFIEKKSINSVIQRWWLSRSTLRQTHLLNRHNLYIFPSKVGCSYLVMIVALWLLGTNYSNNLVLSFSYLLLSVMVVVIFHTFSNLAGLQLKAMKTAAVFCGEKAVIKLDILQGSITHRQNIHLSWKAEAREAHQNIHSYPVPLIADSDVIELNITTTYRGYFQIPLLQIESYYPFGLFRCWSYLALDTPVLVYPTPASSTAEPSRSLSLDEGDTESKVKNASSDLSFQGLKPHQQGESLQRVSWKHFARTGVLLNKDYAEHSAPQSRLNWDDYPGVEGELRLQYLCGKALAMSEQGGTYSLKLPTLEIESGEGEIHRQQVLKALALYEFTLNNHTDRGLRE